MTYPADSETVRLGMPLELHEVTAVIVTDGSNPDTVAEIGSSLIFPHGVVWDNSGEHLYDYGAFGRYAAQTLPLLNPFVKTPVVYVQGDDRIVPIDIQQALVEQYEDGKIISAAALDPDYPFFVNLDEGALFDRALPMQAFANWLAGGHDTNNREFQTTGCNIVFPVLSAVKRITDRIDTSTEYVSTAEKRYYDDAAALR